MPVDFNALVSQANEQRLEKHRRLAANIASALRAYEDGMKDDITAESRSSLEKAMHLRPGATTRAAGLFTALQVLTRKEARDDGAPIEFRECEASSDLAAALLTYAATYQTERTSPGRPPTPDELMEMLGTMTASVMLSVGQYAGSYVAAQAGKREYDLTVQLRRLVAETLCLAADGAGARTLPHLLTIAANVVSKGEDGGSLGDELKKVWGRYVRR